jgi:hypothetical protein
MGLVEAVAAFRGYWEALVVEWRGQGAGRDADVGMTNRPDTLPVVEPDGDVVWVPYAALRHVDLIDEAGEVRMELI